MNATANGAIGSAKINGKVRSIRKSDALATWRCCCALPPIGPFAFSAGGLRRLGACLVSESNPAIERGNGNLAGGRNRVRRCSNADKRRTETEQLEPFASNDFRHGPASLRGAGPCVAS